MTMTSHYVTVLERELHYVAALNVPGQIGLIEEFLAARLIAPRSGGADCARDLPIRASVALWVVCPHAPGVPVRSSRVSA